MRRMGIRAKVTLTITFLLLAELLASSAEGQSAPDFSQAQAMLELLRSCHDNKIPADAIDRVLALAGTGLVVQQQNISRRVTVQQYREVLQAACLGKVAEVKPAEAGARAEKGVAGLTQDVDLRWCGDEITLHCSKRNWPSCGAIKRSAMRSRWPANIFRSKFQRRSRFHCSRNFTWL